MFVLVSAIIIKNRMDIYDIVSNSTHRQLLGQIIYNQLDYVIRLLTNQGNIILIDIVTYIL